MKKVINIFLSKKTFIYIAIIVLLSAYPRLWNLNTKPPIIVDESANIRMIKEIIQNRKFGFTEFHWDFSKTILSYYPTILALEILGSERDLLALRLSSVFLSILALPPFYLIVKNLTDDKIAFITTLLFSYSYFFLQFSRVGWVDIIFVLTLGLYLIQFLNRGLKKQKGALWIFLSGVTSALIFYAYRSGIIYIILSLLYLAISLYLKKVGFKRAFSYLLIFILTFGILIVPWAIKISQNLDKYNLRARVVDIRNIETPYHQFFRTNDIYKYQVLTSIRSWVLLEGIDGGGHENPRYLPLIISPLNILIRISFWIGGITILLNRRLFEKAYIWFLIILVSIFIGQVLTVNPPNGARALISLPSYYIIASITFSTVYKMLKTHKITTAVLIFLALLFTFYDFYTYQLWMEWIRV